MFRRHLNMADLLSGQFSDSLLVEQLIMINQGVQGLKILFSF